MRTPDVLVTIEGGVAQVDVNTPGILVEVRDFDVEDATEEDVFLWTNGEGDRCWRYFVGDEADQATNEKEPGAKDAAQAPSSSLDPEAAP